MSEYRTSAREVVPNATVPDLPDAARLRWRAKLGLAGRLSIASGVLGWLAVSPLARDLDRPFLDDGYVEPAPDAALWIAAPALLTTAVLTFVLVWLSVGARAPAIRAIVLGGVLGAANGSLYLAIHGALEGRGMTPVLAGAACGIVALIVSAPLGLVFGLGLAPFVAAATTALAKPSHVARAHVLGLGAAALGIAALVSVPLASLARAEVATAVGVGLGALSLASALEALARAQTLGDLRAAVASGVHPALVTIPLDDATVERELVALDAPTAPHDAVVARRDLDDPLGRKPVALALVAAVVT